ncbi:ImmA/IrrE family metallo-endopeptidase [Amycolatopsis sp.]|uniref:ImmA/IrrE family metallo-endopeptidase n=1 Tax=Amycolatopsis sp. TaxID=37632 RepID=UPI0039C8AFCC
MLPGRDPDQLRRWRPTRPPARPALGGGTTYLPTERRFQTPPSDNSRRCPWSRLQTCARNSRPHLAKAVERVGGHNFFTGDAEEEQEANWLARCLHLPRPGLLQEGRAGATADDLAARHEVSTQMATWRLNASGVLLQVRRARG